MELGKTSGTRVCSGSGHMSLLPTRLAPDHCCHDPRVDDDAHPASSQAGLCPPSHWTCPCAPSNVRLGRLSPRRRAWSQGRRARSGGVSHTSERLKSLPHLSAPQGTPEALPYLILRRMSGTSQSRCTVLRLAAAAPAGCRCALGGRKEPGVSVAAGRGRWGERYRGGGMKMPFILPIRLKHNLVLSEWWCSVHSCELAVLPHGQTWTSPPGGSLPKTPCELLAP